MDSGALAIFLVMGENILQHKDIGHFQDCC